jgi:hypothetical protein
MAAAIPFPSCVLSILISFAVRIHCISYCTAVAAAVAVTVSPSITAPAVVATTSTRTAPAAASAAKHVSALRDAARSAHATKVDMPRPYAPAADHGG